MTRGAGLRSETTVRALAGDLQPDNVMLVGDPETPDGERVKIFDFGIAKLRVDSLGPRQPQGFQTGEGVIMGTPTHMAPEQCRGSLDITGKADVYALGVIIYQMLAGHAPFLGVSAGELLSAHLRDKPPSLLKIDPSIPEEVAELCHRMLAKDQDERPTMDEVVVELEAMGASRSRATSIAHSRKSSTTPGRSRPFIQTLQHAVGQTFGATSSRRYAVAIAVAAVLVVGSLVALVTELRGCNPAADAGLVSFQVDSTPHGATVLRADNGQVLGKTPWRSQQPRQTGQLALVLRLPGYDDGHITLDLSASSRREAYLERPPVTAPVVRAATPPSEPAAFSTGPTPTKPPVQRLSWPIQSKPKGAQVLREGTAEVLGVTPFTYEAEAQTGVLRLIVRKEGYADYSLLLDLSRGETKQVPLTRLPGKGRGPGKGSPGGDEEIPLFDGDPSNAPHPASPPASNP